MDTTVKYNEPWIMQRADPFVLLGEDGWYYFSASVPAYDKIILRRAKSLSELANATEKCKEPKTMNSPLKHFLWICTYLRIRANGIACGQKKLV